MQKNALLLGATGLVGSTLLTKLLDSSRYNSVTILIRRPIELQHPKLNQHVISFDDLLSNPEKLKPYFQVDDIYCCLGTTMKIAKTHDNFKKIDFDYPLRAAKLGKEMGASCFVLNSSVGADASASSFYLKTKGELEQAIKNLKYKKFSVVRPSFLMGERALRRSGEELAIALLNPIRKLMLGTLKKYRPTDCQDVANAMLDLASQTNVQAAFEVEQF